MMYSPDRANHSTAVCLTACGNYALVGARNGLIYRYNLQSGQSRGSYPNDATRSSALKRGTEMQRATVPGNVQGLRKEVIEAKGWAPLNPKPIASEEEKGENELESAAVDELVAPSVNRHSQDVRGLFVDMTNSTVVSCSLDGYV